MESVGNLNRKAYGINAYPQFIGDDITIRLQLQMMAKDQIPARALKKINAIRQLGLL